MQDTIKNVSANISIINTIFCIALSGTVIVYFKIKDIIKEKFKNENNLYRKDGLQKNK